MSLETELVARLQTVCPRVFPDVAPLDTERPYITWQQIGGDAPVYVEAVALNQRNAFVQVNCWADTRAQANALSQQVEQALVTATTMQAQPQSALIAAHDEDTDRRGAQQDFSIWALR